MKKLTALLLMLILMFSVVGCNIPSSNEKEEDVIKADCYVLHVKPDGFVAYINDIGEVYIQYPNALNQIEKFDTVIIEYYETNLIKTDGTYMDVSGERASYSYKIANPKSVRVADPSNGDPVFY